MKKELTLTTVKFKIADEPKAPQRGKILAYCTITLNGQFIVYDFKILRDDLGNLYVGMPSRRLYDKCERCNFKNVRFMRFCNGCGCQLPPYPEIAEDGRRPKVFEDSAHPIDSEFRAYLSNTILDSYESFIRETRRLLEQQNV